MVATDRRGVPLSLTDSPTIGVPSADLAIKTACLVATTGNITLSGAQVVDGVTVGNNGERVLVLDQTDPTTNGIYIASSGTWTRTTDADGNTELANGQQVLVTGGQTNGGYKTYVLTAANPVTIGTSALTYQALAFPASEIPFVFNGGGGLPIQPGYFGVIPVPFNCAIESVTLLADVATNLVLDIRRVPAGTAWSGPPSSGSSIVAGDPPTLSGALYEQDTTLAGWTTLLSTNDLLAFFVVSNTLASVVTCSLQVVRN